MKEAAICSRRYNTQNNTKAQNTQNKQQMYTTRKQIEKEY